MGSALILLWLLGANWASQDAQTVYAHAKDFTLNNMIPSQMNIRTAKTADIPQIQIVRNAVKENVLSNPSLVTDDDCQEYIHERGRGWVCEMEDEILGFAIVDLVDNNIWALFLKPAFEKQGIGRQLHDTMLDWYFEQTKQPVWLGTAPGTRAEAFYRQAGWTAIGTHGNGEIKFEMTAEAWESRSRP